ncbi:MAG: hypothetical protein AAF558_13590 [Verrucomicrobiota bacterium]
MLLTAEQALHSFVESTKHYFKKETWANIRIEDAAVQLQYPFDSGICSWVKLTGLANGWVILSAPQEMVEVLLREKNRAVSEIDCREFMKEMAEAISENAKKDLGTDLNVEVVQQDGDHPNFSDDDELPVFVVPMVWRNHQANLVMLIENLSV